MEKSRTNINSKLFHSNGFMIHAEIRKVEDVFNAVERDGTTTEYHRVLLTIDDDDLERFELLDPDISNLENYKRGMIGTFKIRIDAEFSEFGEKVGSVEKAKITVVDFVEDEA